MSGERLAEYLRDRAGENLRGVIEYDGDGYEINYMREDLDADAFRQRVEYAYTRILQGQTNESELAAFGKSYATLSVREYAVILNLRRTPTEGILVGLDPGAARQLVSFIHDSLEHAFPEGDPSEREAR